MIPFLLIGAGAYLLYDAQATKMAKGGLAGFDVSKLDPFEAMQYKHLTEKSKLSKEDALGVIINNVEGDYSQLSKKLASLAKQLYDIPTKQMTLLEDGGMVSISDEDYEFSVGGEEYLGKAIKENGVIVGGIAYNDEDQEIQGISIKNKFRKKGIAKKAVKKLFDNDKNLEAVYVRSVPKSKKFWEKIGTDFDSYNDDAGLWEGTLKRFEDGGPVLGWRVMYMRNIKTRGGEMLEIMQDNDVFTGTLDNAKIFAEREMRSNNADKVIIKDPVDKVRGAVIKKSDIV